MLYNSVVVIGSLVCSPFQLYSPRPWDQRERERRQGVLETKKVGVAGEWVWWGRSEHKRLKIIIIHEHNYQPHTRTINKIIIIILSRF